jgi:predicted ABC-type sugar transport system permease subunit
MWERKYQKVTAEDDEESNDTPSAKTNPSWTNTSITLSPYPWMISSLSLLTVVIFLLFREQHTGAHNYALGFRTELGKLPTHVW